MKKSWVLWILALVITLSSAVYQRKTGPTYPIDGDASLNGKEITYSLLTSHSTNADLPVEINAPDGISGTVSYKRYKTADEWTEITFERTGPTLTAYLPKQPPAGKLMYTISLTDGTDNLQIKADDPVIIRFKGDVPALVLAPHVILMFAAMLFSSRAGLEAIFRRESTVSLTYWTTGMLFLGGMILGPVVQEYAFGAFWTGFPFGYDLTDNKTLIAMIGWLFASYMCWKSEKPEKWVVTACIILFAIYLIPHSVMGSELDYSKLPEGQ